MPRRLTREERLQRLQREERADLILDEIIANANWLNFQTHLANQTYSNKIKCPLCRCSNNIDLNNCSSCVGECIICFQDNKQLLTLPCHATHSFCKNCLEKLI